MEEESPDATGERNQTIADVAVSTRNIILSRFSERPTSPQETRVYANNGALARAFDASPQGRSETTSPGFNDIEYYLDDDDYDVANGSKKRKILEETLYDDEENSSFRKPNPSEASSESEAEQMDLNYAPAKNPPSDVIHSVRAYDILSGKRKREIPFGYVSHQPMQPLGDFGVSTPSGSQVAAASRPTTVKSPDQVVNDDADGVGGVFDDADDDIAFELPTYTPSTAPARRRAILSPAFPSPPKGARNRSVKPGYGVEGQIRRRRAPHQLNGKKETESARAFLADKDDLLQVLPSEDCHFLAKSLWIFTVQQLEALIPAALSPPKPDERDLREELLNAIAASSLVGSNGSSLDADDLTRQSEKCNTLSDPKQPDIGGNVKETPDGSDSNSELDGSDPPLSSLRLGSQVASQKLKQILPTNGDFVAAKARLVTWSGLITAWRQKTAQAKPQLLFAKTTSPDDKFPLDGPVSCLMPQGLQNFLATLKIFSLSQFLSLRKTESGLVTTAFRKWRNLCNLSILPDVLLSKHLLGITSRMEVAVTSVPWADFETRRWMGGELVVLTGAARDFLIDECKIHDPEEFVSLKTKGLADVLEKWREARNMPPLKGTGKVAMISGWKTNVKEELLITRDEGDCFRDLDLLELAEQDCRDASESKVSKKKGKGDAGLKKPRTDDNISRMDAALRSPQFFKNVLGHENSSVLVAVGIDTAEKLFNAEKQTSSPLVQKLFEAGKSSQPDSSVRLNDLKEMLRGKLEELKDVKETKSKSKALSQPFGRPAFKPTVDSERARIDPSHRTDPIDALSATARAFLASLDILCAKDLLTTRTTDIANAFVPWREANNLPVLKGLGAIASVSGWKATVRKASAEMGFPEFSEVAPKHMPTRVQTLTPPPQTDLHASSAHIEPMTHPGLLFGASSRRFTVRCNRGLPMLYLFQLSVRSSYSEERSEAVYLSYLGSKQVLADINAPHQTEGNADCFRKDRWDLRFDPILPVLSDSQDVLADDPRDLAIRAASEPFSSNFPGCGIIELTKFGVFPLIHRKVKNGQLVSLKWEITKFFDMVGKKADVFCASFTEDEIGAFRRRTRLTSNAFTKTSTNGGARCFAFIKEPVERGQTVELLFTSFSSLNFDPNNAPAVIRQRLPVADAVGSLPLEDVAQAIDFLITESLQEITKQIQDCLMPPSMNYALLGLALQKRRRLHWVTSLLIRHATQGSTLPDILTDAKSSAVKQLLWDSEISSVLSSVSDSSKTELLKILKADIENEIVFEMKACGYGSLFTDNFLVCCVADECLRLSLEVVSCHLTKQNKVYTMSNLLSELAGLITKSVALIMSEDSFPSKDLELARRPICTVAINSDEIDSKERQQGEEGQCDSNRISTTNEISENVSSTALTRSMGSGFAAENRSLERHGESSIGGSGYPKVILVTRDELISGRAKLNRRWYIENQVLFIVHAVVSIGASQWPHLEEAFSLSELRKAAYQAAQTLAQEEPEVDGSPYLDIRMFLNSQGIAPRCEPHPLPIFLGTVWPKLSKLGWRLEIGNRPDKFAFLPPGQASSNRKAKDARVKQIKQERVRKRAKFAKEASETGLGYIPKLSKHLFAKSVQVDERGADDEEEISQFSVASALEKFRSMVESDLPAEDVNSRDRLRIIVDQIRFSFNELSHRLLLTDENPRNETVAGQEPSKVYGCQYLMRFLLVLPAMLHEADVPEEQLQDTLSISKELLNFLAKNHQDVFEESFHPPEEELQTEVRFEPFLAPKLSRLSASIGETGSSNQVYLAEGADVIVLPSDRASLTNFVDLVMSQFLVCRATVEDAGKKNRRIHPGHPGLLCRHCRGDGGEGRYFFSSVESLSTAATVLEKHISRCPYIAGEMKARMVQYRAQHGEQRLTLQSGSLGAYYARLYDRLVNSKSSGDPNVYSKPAADSVKEEPMSSVSSLSGTGIDDAGQGVPEFRSHIHLLEYIKRTDEWYNREEVMDGLKEYYNCLEFGGRVFGTNAMPTHFSAEWVLGKVGPRTQNRFHRQSD